MKRKVLSVLLVAAICTVMAGCEGKSSAVTETAPAVSDDIAAEDPATSEYMDDAAMADSYTEQQEDQVAEDIEDNFGSPSTDWDETEDVISEVPEGIIVLQNYYHYADSSGNMMFYSITYVNPGDGTSQEVAIFSAKEPFNTVQEKTYYICPKIGRANNIGGDRWLFSEDFTKMAITKCFNDKNETHAGWIDQQGNFFDVTEALGEQSGDFDEAVHYAAVGFTEDGNFVYKDNYSKNPKDWGNANFYYTPIEALAQSQNGNPLENQIQVNNGRNIYYVTDEMGDSKCVVDFQNDSFIYDANTDSVTPYIPGDSRINWSGVISSNGDNIAFLSVPKDTNDTYGNTALYIAFVSSDESPAKVSYDLMSGCDGTMLMWALLGWK